MFTCPDKKAIFEGLITLYETSSDMINEVKVDCDNS
jgi:hypothetical protein